MKTRTLRQLRAAAAGLTFSIAALAGVLVPAIDAAAATGVTNITATYNSTSHKVDVTWTGTGVAGDT